EFSTLKAFHPKAQGRRKAAHPGRAIRSMRIPQRGFISSRFDAAGRVGGHLGWWAAPNHQGPYDGPLVRLESRTSRRRKLLSRKRERPKTRNGKEIQERSGSARTRIKLGRADRKVCRHEP